MRSIGISAIKDLRRRLADRLSLAGWILIPLLLGLLIASVSGAFGGTPRARVLLTGEDDPALGESAFPADLFDVERVGEAEGLAQVARGEATALLVVRGDPGSVTLHTNPADRIMPALVIDHVGAILEVAHAGSLPRTRVIDLVNERPGASDVPVGLLFFPGLLLMSLLFVAMGTAEDVWAERDAGTLRRTLAAPGGVVAFTGGKVVAGGVLMLVVSAAGLVLGAATLDVPWSALPGAAAIATLGGTALMCAFMALHVHSSSRRSGRLLSTLVAFPVLMLGGSFFPFDQMPENLAALGRLTPNGLAVLRLGELSRGTAAPEALSLTVLALVALGVVSLGLAHRRLRGSFGTV